MKAQDLNDKLVSIKQVIAIKNSLTKALELMASTSNIAFEDMCFEWSIFDIPIDKSN